MWKKLLIAFIALTGTFTVGYAYYNYEMSAAVTPFQLQKGQKVVLGKYNNREIVWDIGNNTSNYVLMSSKPLVNSIATYDSSVPLATSDPGLASRENFCFKVASSTSYVTTYCPVTPLKSEIARISTNTNENSIITKAPFLPSISDIITGGTLGLTLNDRAYRTSPFY